MALIKCKECDKDVSSEAETCPHCGAKLPKKRIWPKVLMGIIATPILLIILINVFMSPESKMEIDAEANCKKIILQLLKSPGSAEFVGVITTSSDKGTYRVKGYVDSQNSFGAKMRSSFWCDYKQVHDAGKLERTDFCLAGMIPGVTCN